MALHHILIAICVLLGSIGLFFAQSLQPAPQIVRAAQGEQITVSGVYESVKVDGDAVHGIIRGNCELPFYGFSSKKLANGTSLVLTGRLERGRKGSLLLAESVKVRN